MKGVDISHYQDGLTIRQIMDAGKDFAIIKVTEGTGYIDTSAFEYYREAHELGFPLGGYCYSHATEAAWAELEAAHIIRTMNGFPMPCGVYLDMEEPQQLELDHDTLMQIIRVWCKTIDRAGYTPGIYSSAGTLWAKVHPDEVPVGCLVWVAKWSDTPPDLPCDLWQNSDKGTIPGYDGPVDTDEGRNDYFKALVDLARTVPPEDAAPDACPTTAGTLELLAGYLKTADFARHFQNYIREVNKNERA